MTITETARTARITTSGLSMPIPRPTHEAPREFVHRFVIEHRTTNPEVTPNQVASAALEAMRSVDEGWYRSKIVESYEVKEPEKGGSTDSNNPPEETSP